MLVAEIETEIRSFLANKVSSARTEKLGDDDPLLGSVIDSNGVLEFVTFLQDRFGITIDDEDITMENLDSVKNAAAFIDRKLASSR